MVQYGKVISGFPRVMCILDRKDDDYEQSKFWSKTLDVPYAGTDCRNL